MTIELAAIELYGFHGVEPAERDLGQRFLVDLELELKSERAASTDDIDDTVDYRAAIDLVREISDGRVFNLLEAFASALADALLTTFAVSRVRVRVCKPDVVLPLPVGHSAVVVERFAR